jgi:hypothetical protein
VLPRLFRRERPGGRSLVLEGKGHHDSPLMLTEFGGITYSNAPNTWGYARVESSRAFERSYTTLLQKVHELGAFAGSATRSSPIPIRKRTACSLQTARRSFRWRPSTPRPPETPRPLRRSIP